MKGKKIAIIGAGPGGIAAGIALQQAGFEVKIFEKTKEITPLGGAIILNATGIVILRKLGVNVDDIFAARLPEFRRYDGKVRVKFDLDPKLLEKAGVTGWQSGMMRQELYKRMLQVVPEGMIVTDHVFDKFIDEGDSVKIFFKNGKTEEADILIGADGINSQVRQQLWNTPKPKKLGIAVWLGWCEVDGTGSDNIVIQHNRDYQFGYAPLLFEGKKCYEWWFVEKYKEGQSVPENKIEYIQKRVKDFVEPSQTILNSTDPNHQLFRWVVEYIPGMKQWTKGRVTLMGDAAHPTSPYAAYGAGMAIEDAFFIAKYLRGVDLSNIAEASAALAKYENQRRPYTNYTTRFARILGRIYHNIPTPLKYLRDFFLDNSSIPGKKIAEGVTEEATSLLASILDED